MLKAAAWLLMVADAAVGAVPPPAEPAPPAKPSIHALSDIEAQVWIAAAKAFKTGDGTTVLAALEHARRQRPDKFFFGKFAIGYNARSGEPDAVTVDTWIGSKRQPADANTVMLLVKRANGRPVVAIPKSSGLFLDGLRQGRTALVAAVDEQYEDVCIDQTTRAKSC